MGRKFHSYDLLSSKATCNLSIQNMSLDELPVVQSYIAFFS